MERRAGINRPSAYKKRRRRRRRRPPKLYSILITISRMFTVEQKTSNTFKCLNNGSSFVQI
jgi:hypothetical protein